MPKQLNFDNRIVACICEGSAEEAIMTILLENNKLKFTTSQLLEEQLIRERAAKQFEKKYLRQEFGKLITIVRILDSKHETFTVSKAYKPKIDEVINIITAPEIEKLIILHENKFTAWNNSKLKPSLYCKQELGFTDVKKPEFVRNYFSDVKDLVSAIREYKRVSKLDKNEYCLCDLLSN